MPVENPIQSTRESGFPMEELGGAGKRLVGNQVVDNTESVQEESAWESYRPIGTSEYEEANQERVKDGKIKVTELGTAEHSITLVANINVDPETGAVIDGHDYHPEAVSMADTEKAFAEYLARTPADKRAIIYEGDQRVFNDREQSIREASDSGLIQHLAAKERIPTMSGEPTVEEETKAMEALGVSRQELLALTLARGLEAEMTSGSESLAGYINFHAARLGLEGFKVFSEEEKQAIEASGKLDETMRELEKKAQEILPAINQLYSPALGGIELFVTVEGKIALNPEYVSRKSEFDLGWSGSTRISEVARLDMEVRDRVIFHRILEAYRQGKSPLVAYGGSHVVTIVPALRSYLA